MSRQELESDIAELGIALQGADSAGDVERATKYAQAYKTAKNRLTLMTSNPAEYDPESEEFQAKYGAQSDSNFENFAAGAGKFLFDRGRGLKQLYAGAADAIAPRSTLSGLITGQPQSRSAQVEQDIAAARARDRDLMGTKAGLAGNIAGGAAFSAPLALIPGVNTTLGAGLAGAGMGFTEPLLENESRLFSTGLGAAGGIVGQKIGNALTNRAGRSLSSRSSSGATATGGGSGAQANLSGSLNARASGGGYTFGSVGDDASAGLTRAQKDALFAGKQIGMKSTPGQSTGSRALQQLEAKLESQPMTSGPFNAIKDANQKVINRAAARSLGETADTVDATVLNNAYDRFDAGFSRIADRAVRRDIEPQASFSFLRDLQDEFADLTNVPILKEPLIKRIIKLAGDGEADGAVLQNLTSKLGRKAHNNLTSASGDRELGRALLRAKDFVDDLIESGLTGQDRQAFAALRSQYRNYKLLTSRNNVLNPSTGNVNGGALAGLLQQKDPAGFLRGGNQSDLYNAARFAQAFKPIVGDSGTATRSTLNGPLDMAMALPFNLGARAYASSPSVAAFSSADSVLNNTARMLGPAANPGLLGVFGAQGALQAQ